MSRTNFLDIRKHLRKQYAQIFLQISNNPKSKLDLNTPPLSNPQSSTFHNIFSNSKKTKSICKFILLCCRLSDQFRKITIWKQMLNMNLKSHFICNFRFNYYQHADEILNGHQTIEIYWKMSDIMCAI